MTSYTVVLNETTRVTRVIEEGTPIPNGFTNLGILDHNPESDSLQSIESHVLYHHLRDMLYRSPLKEQSMQAVTITVDAEYAPIMEVPNAPQIFVVPGDGNVSIAFLNTGSGGSRVQSYKLYRRTGGGDYAFIKSITTGSPYTDTTVSNDVTYHYKLTAVNAQGESEFSAEAEAVPTAVITTPVPTWLADPYITGSTYPIEVGTVLTATGGSIFNGEHDGWLWTYAGETDEVAFGSSYTVKAQDVGKAFTVTEYATGPGGTTSKTSVSVGPVESEAPVEVPNPTPPVITLGAGVSDGANHIEATALTGVINVKAQAGTTVNIVFSRSTNTVNKSVAGTGADVPVMLSEGNLTTLGDGVINVAATATKDGKTSSIASSTFTLEPDPVASSRVSVVWNWDDWAVNVTNYDDFPDATWSWYDDTGALIESADWAYLNNNQIPEGRGVKCVANGDMSTASDLCFMPQDQNVWVSNLNGVANGTELVGYRGWVGGTLGRFAITGGKLQLMVAGGGANNKYTLDMPSDNYSFEAVLDFSQVLNSGNSQTKIRCLGVNYIDSNNYIYLYAFGNGVAIKANINGVESMLTSNMGPGNDGVGQRYKISAQTIDGVVHVKAWRNGVLIAGTGQGIPVPGLASSPKVWISHNNIFTDAANPSYPISYADEVAIRAVSNDGITVMETSFTEPTNIAPAGISIVVTTDFTELDTVVMGEDGRIYGSIISHAGLTPGEVTLYVPTPPEAMTIPASVRIRNAADPSIHVDHHLGVLPYYDSIDALQFGINLSGGNAYTAADNVKDRGYVASWRYKGSAGQMYIPPEHKNADGWPLNVPMPVGYDTERWAIVFEGPPPSIRTGTWKVSANVPTPGGMQITNVSNLTISNKTETTMDLTTINPDVGQSGYLVFPASVVPPPEGLQISCDTNPGVGDLVTLELADIYHADIFNSDRISVRNMKLTGADSAIGGTETPVLVGIQGTARYAADATHLLKADIHWNMPWADVANRKETAVRSFIEEFDSLADGASILAGSVGNEVWNLGYNRQRNGMAARGLKMGLIEGITVPEGVVVLDENYNEQGTPNGRVLTGSGDATTRGIFYPGEWFYAAVGGYQHALIEVTATEPMPVGSLIPQNGNANFTKRAGYNDGYLAALRLQSVLQKDLGQIGKSIMGDRFVSTYECWLNDSAQNIANYMLFNDAWQYIDEFSPTFYAGSAVDYGTLSWHSKHTTDLAAFKAGYLARWEATWANTMSMLIHLKHEVPRIMLEAGVPRNQLPRMRRLYEGGDHNTITNVPTDQRDGLRLAILATLNSVEGAAATGKMWADMRKYLGGPMEYFIDFEKTWYNWSINQMQSFGLRQYMIDGSWNNNGADEGRYNATVAAFA